MAAALPVTKLAGLLVKTLSKPLSKRIKHEATRYEFSKRALLGIGQASHQLTSRMTIWASGYSVRSVQPLPEEKAIKTGSEFVGESFVLLVSGAIVIFEYNRSAASSKAKDEKKRQEAKKERLELQEKLIALDTRLKALEDAVEENTRTMMFQKNFHPPKGVPRIVDEIKEEEEDEIEATSASPAKDTKGGEKKEKSSVLRWLGFGR